MTLEFRADLHCHTTASDGSMRPAELIQKASAIPLQGLSITDHDTIDAYEEALPEACRLHLPLLSGLELSTVYEKESVHILAYGFSLRSGMIAELLENQKRKRRQRNQKILANLAKLGIKITLEENEKQALGRPHIALAMVEKGVISSVKEGFDKYLGEGKAAYEPGERLQVVEAIEKIKEAKGVAILAHPHLVSRKRTLKVLLGMPFDGVECYYAMMSKERVAPFLQIATQKGWIATGGSDFHGATKPHILLGSSWVGKEVFDRLYDDYQRNETSTR